jgi:acetyltransferase-like isoleucine patch superfamily enzyme
MPTGGWRGVVSPIMRAIAGTIWIYSYLSLGAFMALAGVPGLYLARWGWSLDATPAWAGSAAGTIDLFVGLYFSVLGFFTFGLAFMVVNPLVRAFFLHVLRWKPHQGEMSIHSFRMWFWYNHNGLVFTFNTVFGRFARLTNVYNWYLRGMGAKIGKNVVFNTQHVYDLDLIEVGDNTVIGANASILGHVGEKGKLVRMPVKIGNRCTIGQYSNIFPGVTMGDNCHVGAMSLVPKGTQLDANAVYGGVPVRKIRDLQPGERVTSDDLSATTGTPKGRG